MAKHQISNMLSANKNVARAEFHFYGCNTYEWKTSTNLHELMQWFVIQKPEYELWYIPLADNGSVYAIEQYAPQVKNAVYLGKYKGLKRS
jgi:hypothetical protein